jgi:hypothetical protein
MKRYELILAFTIAAALALGPGCQDSSTGPPGVDTITVIFRDGAEPLPSYTGTRDAVIKDGAAAARRSENNGQRDVDTLGVTDIGGTLYGQRMILRFSLGAITDCGTVTEATLTISIEPADTNETVYLDVYEVTTPGAYAGSWDEGFLDDGVSWLYLDGESPWDDPGGDVLGLLDSKSVKADTVVTFELDAARVERWIKNPPENHGVLIVPRTSGEAFVYAYMREIAAVSLRPELVVTYTKYAGGG